MHPEIKMLPTTQQSLHIISQSTGKIATINQVKKKMLSNLFFAQKLFVQPMSNLRILPEFHAIEGVQFRMHHIDTFRLRGCQICFFVRIVTQVVQLNAGFLA